MNKYISALIGLIVAGGVALAETDPIAMDVLRAIRLGEAHPQKAIKVLRVLDDVILPAGKIGSAEVASSTFQAYDTDLTAWGLITPSTAVTNVLRSSDAAGMRTRMGVAIGSDVQAYDADLAAVAANKSVISKTGSGLKVEYGAATNLGTIAWSAVFAGTPSVVACYWGGKTNTLGKLAAAQISTANATNCVVRGDAADTAAFIYVIAVGVQ